MGAGVIPVQMNSLRKASFLLALSALCSCQTTPHVDDRELLPASFVTTNLWLGMPLWEAKAAYPKYTASNIHPRALLLGLDPSPRKSFQKKGTISYMTSAIFLDEKLLGTFVPVTYLGKTSTGVLSPEEFEQLQKDLVSSCERQYGKNPDRVSSRKASGKETMDIVWNKPDYVATLSLPRNEKLIQVQLLGALSIMKNKAKSKASDDGSTEEMKEVLNSIGLPVKQ